jgi:hypothetical protein
MADKINPDHYKNNPIETCDAIFSQLTEAEKIGACKFNISKYIFRSGKKVKGLEGYRDDVGKAHWYIERLLKELTDMIKIRQANKQSDNQDMERDLTDEELLELDNPGFVSTRKPSWNWDWMLKEMNTKDIIEIVGEKAWNEHLKKNKKPGKIFKFKKKEDKDDKNSK